MPNDNQYMVDFTLPDSLTEEFLGLIPSQRAKVNKLFREGKLVNYALSLDHSKIWAVLNGKSEVEVEEMIAELPLSKFMDVQISILTFYNAMNADVPVFSMN
jgi:muconolactone delta-isomerase